MHVSSHTYLAHISHIPNFYYGVQNLIYAFLKYFGVLLCMFKKSSKYLCIILHYKRRGYSRRTKTSGEVKRTSRKDKLTFFAASGRTSGEVNRERYSRRVTNTASRMPLPTSFFPTKSMASGIPLSMLFLATKSPASRSTLPTSFLPTHIVARE